MPRKKSSAPVKFGNSRPSTVKDLSEDESPKPKLQKNTPKVISKELKIIEDYKSSSEYSVRVNCSSKLSSGWTELLSSFSFKISSPLLFTSLKNKTFEIFFSPLKNKSIILFSPKDFYVLQESDLIWDSLYPFRKFRSKEDYKLPIELISVLTQSDVIVVDVYLKQELIQMTNERSTSINRIISPDKKRWIETIFNVSLYEQNSQTSKNYSENLLSSIEGIYDNVQSSRNFQAKDHTVDPQHPCLKPILRKYQRDAVQWMYEKETLEERAMTFYTKIFTPKNKRTLYINNFSGVLSEEEELDYIIMPKGGILADEMGLGKTVEILSLILSHPRLNVKLPEYKEPLVFEKPKRSKRSKRKRSLSPTEFILESSISQLDGEDGDLLNEELDIKSEILNDEENENDDEVKSNFLIQNNQDIKIKNDVESPIKAKRVKKKTTAKKTVTSKSSMSDMIMDCMRNSPSAKDGVSVISMKKYITTNYSKPFPKNNKHFKMVLSNLVEKSMTLVPTIGSYRGATGSFVFNPHPGTPYTFPCKKKKTNPTLYDKLKQQYDIQLESLSAPTTSTFKWNGTFFDTTVDRKDFFECICGEAEHENSDDNPRIKCEECTVYQHLNCVKFDGSDPYRGPYKCPSCWSESTPVPSKATLIISPSIISYQWIEEIQKHVKSAGLKILFYKGTKASGYIQPVNLARYDVVITTYSILRSETNYVDIPHINASEGRKFRNPKRFMALSAPLPCVQWWRVCLDEAQMVESTTSKIAEMALRLQCINRWCITGTPTGKSIDDLFGLFVFLGYDPYHFLPWWNTLISKPFSEGDSKPLEDLLTTILWRTAKKNVLPQIDIPPQTEEIHFLSFSPVEEHFYRRQHIEVSKDLVSKVNKVKSEEMTKLCKLEKTLLSSILQPLIKLRQSCCHPQAVKGQFIPFQKSALTMEELTTQMIRKVTVECEDYHRQRIAALNGLAGIQVIEENWIEAVETYRDVLRIVAEYENKIKTDTLQKLHTISNLKELLDARHGGVHPTLRDDSLSEEMVTLKKKYLLVYDSKLKVSHSTLLKHRDSIKELYDDIPNVQWFNDIVDSIDSTGEENALLKIVQDEMASLYEAVTDVEFKQVQEKYPNSRVILYKIVDKIKELDKLRAKVLSSVLKLAETSPSEYVNSAVDCHLRTSSLLAGSKNQCALCANGEIVKKYEKTLLHFVKGDIRKHAIAKRSSLSQSDKDKLQDAGVHLADEEKSGTWADSELERLCRALLKYSRSQKVLRKLDDNTADSGYKYMELFVIYKKEFKELRSLWNQTFDRIAGEDELNMSTLRLRLQSEEEVIPEELTKKPNKTLANRQADAFETIYILKKHEISTHKLKLISEKTIAVNEFRKKHGQLLYLKNLQASETVKENGENIDPCPICRKNLGSQWSVLQCGHCFCIECIRLLIDEYSTGVVHKSVKCAVCRSLTFHAEISYVNTTKETSNEDSAFKVVGSLSTKIESVVRTLLKIQAEDENSKALVFSNWVDVLEILESALEQNNIPYSSVKVAGNFKKSLQKFKNRSDVKVLLLPISCGANGLNLVEATHVLLLEPILNPAQELQAIGRVHRIGQKLQTVVHKFIIKNTIEEKMHEVLQNHSKESSDENVLTIKDLKTIFVDDDN